MFTANLGEVLLRAGDKYTIRRLECNTLDANRTPLKKVEWILQLTDQHGNIVNVCDHCKEEGNSLYDIDMETGITFERGLSMYDNNSRVFILTGKIKFNCVGLIDHDKEVTRVIRVVIKKVKSN